MKNVLRPKNPSDSIRQQPRTTRTKRPTETILDAVLIDSGVFLIGGILYSLLTQGQDHFNWVRLF